MKKSFKKMIKKSFSVFLVLLMVAMLLPVSAMASSLKDRLKMMEIVELETEIVELEPESVEIELEPEVVEMEIEEVELELEAVEAEPEVKETEVTYANGETYATGAIPVSTAEYATLPKAPNLGTARASLPASVDLSHLVPRPGNQGSQGSCTSWAVAYGYKSMQEKVERGWDLSTANHQFSPAYLHGQLASHPGEGVQQYRAFDALVSQGVCTLADMPYNDKVFTQPNSSQRAAAAQYKAASWGTLTAGNVDQAKQRLANGDCVVITLDVGGSDFNINQNNRVYDIAPPSNNEPAWHALCMVGYDDGLKAFKFINSWGTGWGLSGYAYLSYNLYSNTKLTPEAFVMTDIKGQNNNGTFSAGRFGYRPNNQADLNLDNISSFEIPQTYKNRDGNAWFDIYFATGGDAVNASSIKSSNSNVAQFKNYDNNIARFNVKGVGSAELSFTNKAGNQTYRKTVVVTGSGGATFGSGRLGYRPNNQSDLSLDSVSSFEIPQTYKNKDGNAWFDIYFATGADAVNASSIKSSNSNVAQFRNYDNNIARFNVKGAGSAELTFTNKAGTQTYRKTVVITGASVATFGSGRLGYRPNNQSDLNLDSVSSFSIPQTYRNRDGNAWFDIYFATGGDSVNASSIKSSNSNVAQFRNYDNNVARFNVRGAGTAELSFTNKAGTQTYKKTVVITGASASFGSARLAYRPNNQADLNLDNVSSFSISRSYRNRDGNAWFDIVFGTGASSVNASSIRSSNNNVVQFRNYDNNIARFNVKGVSGSATLTFTSKDGSYTYTKTVIVN